MYGCDFSSAMLKDPNFSVGKFFKIRSDQIQNIFQTDKTSPKEKMSTRETTQLLNSELSEMQSKDSASLSDISFLQSLSALDRALGKYRFILSHLYINVFLWK